MLALSVGWLPHPPPNHHPSLPSSFAPKEEGTLKRYLLPLICWMDTRHEET
jgi:hypothetical protein